MTTVNDLAMQQKLIFRRGTYNILDCGIRTGKTYWAVNNLQQYTRDGRLDRVLYLVDTITLKNQIIQQYDDNCADYWEGPSSWGETQNKIGVMCYQGFGARLLKEGNEFLKGIDVVCWDECDSIFDFAAQAFARARKTEYGVDASSLPASKDELKGAYEKDKGKILNSAESSVINELYNQLGHVCFH